MRNREYIRINKPTSSFPTNTNLLRELDDEFWKNWVFYYLLSFYKNFSYQELKTKIKKEQHNPRPRIEREIAKFIRKSLRCDPDFCFCGFKVIGEASNDEDAEGYYDIIVNHSYWKNEFHCECKNLSLEPGKNLIGKYVCYNTGQSIYDGGVYRYFNGKYSQNQDFGGMLGFVLFDNIQIIKSKIIERLNIKFDTSPNGDIKQVLDNSIEENDFTFDSTHNRNNLNFKLHHILFDFTSVF